MMNINKVLNNIMKDKKSKRLLGDYDICKRCKKRTITDKTGICDECQTE